ncbi:MAG: hypothetical protein RIQ52_535 [Pseudomonadota bacterium]|jgi:hypothetical protein
MRHFLFSSIFTVAGLYGAWWWGGMQGLMLASLLAGMEISLSVDNAIVNATIIKDMSQVWRQRFLTWGMIIAVFGVRMLLPLLIVAIISGASLLDVARMAIEHPDDYARHIGEAHVQIAAFGGMYLSLVFFSFLFEEEKTLHWLYWVERRLASMGKLESFEVVLALACLIWLQSQLPDAERLAALLAGLGGIILFVLVRGLTGLFREAPGLERSAHRAGAIAFLYLEVLDMSFSLDGVIGAFAMTRDVVLITMGLAIGAMFVRSLTIYLVEKKMLEAYVFLEHGAHYAIGVLAILMLVDVVYPVSDLLTGLSGLTLILLSFWSSVKHKRALERAG